MTTTATPSVQRRGSAWRRYRSLASAEFRQFLRNKTVVFMSFILPLAMGAFGLAVIGDAFDDGALKAGTAMEIFLLITLMFVQFYSVLSMVTNRRDEKVLKRLRTGEAKDVEIIAAIATPGAVVSLALTAVMLAVTIGVTGAVPSTFLLTFIAVILGIVVSTALALFTSGFTDNAEAAGVTSLPVLIIGMLSQQSIISLLPENIQDIALRTPFALVGELSYLDIAGATPISLADGPAKVTGLEAVGHAGVPLAILAVWAVALGWYAARSMKWETNR